MLSQGNMPASPQIATGSGLNHESFTSNPGFNDLAFLGKQIPVGHKKVGQLPGGQRTNFVRSAEEFSGHRGHCSKSVVRIVPTLNCLSQSRQEFGLFI